MFSRVSSIQRVSSPSVTTTPSDSSGSWKPIGSSTRWVIRQPSFTTTSPSGVNDAGNWVLTCACSMRCACRCAFFSSRSRAACRSASKDVAEADGVAVVPLVASGGSGPSASDPPPTAPDSATPSPTTATTATVVAAMPARCRLRRALPSRASRSAGAGRPSGPAPKLLSSSSASWRSPSSSLMPPVRSVRRIGCRGCADFRPVNPSQTMSVTAYRRRSWTLSSSTPPLSPTTR